MKKLLIILSLITCAVLLSAQTITLSPVNFTTDATVTITAKATVPAVDSLGNICANPAKSYEVWIPTDSILNVSVTGSATLNFVKNGPDHTKPAGYSTAVCKEAFDHYTISIAAGQSLAPGDYALKVNWTNNACSAGADTSILTFTISEPAVPILTIGSPICETDPLVITTSWVKYADGSATTAPSDLTTISIIDYVAHLDVDFCGDGEWHLPAELGLGAAPISLNTSGTTSISGTGPGKAIFHINQIQYTTTSCGTVILNNGTTINDGTSY